MDPNPGIYREPPRIVPPEGEKKPSDGLEMKLLAGRWCVVGHCRNGKSVGRLYADVLGQGRVYADDMEALAIAVDRCAVEALQRKEGNEGYHVVKRK